MDAVFTLVHKLKVDIFDTHFQAYEVGEISRSLYIKSLSDFTSPPIQYLLNNNKSYIRNKLL